MARHQLAALAGVLAVSGAWVGMALPSATAADATGADLVVQPPVQTGPRTFSVDAYNNGPETADSVVLTITGLGNYQVTSQASNCQQTGAQVVCNSQSWEDVHVTGTPEHFAFTFSTGSGPVTLTASVTSATPDPDLSNNSATSVTWTPGDPPTPSPTATPTGNTSPPTQPRPSNKPVPGANPTTGHGTGSGTAHPGSPAPASASAGPVVAAVSPPPADAVGQSTAGPGAPLALADGANAADQATTPAGGLVNGRFAGTVAAPILVGGVIGGLLVARRRRGSHGADYPAADVEEIWFLAPNENDG